MIAYLFKTWSRLQDIILMLLTFRIHSERIGLFEHVTLLELFSSIIRHILPAERKI